MSMPQENEEKETREEQKPEEAEASEQAEPAETEEDKEAPEQAREAEEQPQPAEEEEEEPAPLLPESDVIDAELDEAALPPVPEEEPAEPEVARVAREAAEATPPEEPLPRAEEEVEEMADEALSAEQPSPTEEEEAGEVPSEELPPEEPVSPLEAAQRVPTEEVVPEMEPAAETPTEELPPEEEAEEEAKEEAEPSRQPAAAEETAEKKVRVARTRADKLTTLPDEEAAETRWYVIHAHSGHENKVRQSLENRVRQEHLEHLVSQVLIPSEEVAEVKGGKKRITSRKIFPSYVLVEMKLTHKTWYLIRTTPGVTGFIGSGKMPTPLEPEEVESIFEQMRGEQKKPKPKVSFEKDEKVKIIEGPFTNFMGYVDEVNPERGKLKVMVEIFERLTSVELEFWQVEKI